MDNKRLKKLARARMLETGENYVTARHQIIESLIDPDLPTTEEKAHKAQHGNWPPSVIRHIPYKPPEPT